MEVFIFNIVDLGFEIYDTLKRKEPVKELASVVSILVAIQLLLIGLYFICKRYMTMAMWFNSIATVIVTVGIIERNILDGRSIDSGDSYICIIALVTSISIFGSCQIALLVSYLACQCYIFVR